MNPTQQPPTGHPFLQTPSDPLTLEVPIIPDNVDSVFHTEPTVASLQQELALAHAKADAHWAQYLGAHAEMENIRKRSERDVQNAHKFALERFFNELLPVCDSLSMGLAAAHSGADLDTVREGIALTLRQLTAAMEKFGSQTLDPIGEKFNPHQHEAMAMMPTDRAEPNTIVQVLQKGYVLNERLLRSAKVLVAQALPTPPSGAPAPH